jgi:hypothetical protein
MINLPIKNGTSHSLRFSFGILLFLASTLVSGCFENYGRLKHNTDVTRAFNNNQIEQDYKYYYYGRANMPYAVVGIDREYQMRSRIWREVDQDTGRRYSGSRWKKSRHLVFGSLVGRDTFRGE